jgi:hypothetical protein
LAVGHNTRVNFEWIIPGQDKPSMREPDYEKLGLFYLGKTYDPNTKTLQDDLLLYESKDLTTHAVCVGMTGSGKTGLCLALLEEAAIDGIPVIAIDPKGDIGNLLLTFPELRPEDFRPWVDPAEAARRGLTVDDFAKKTAEQWTKGLAEWGEDGDRIARLRDACDLAIYTPGSSAGLPLTVMRSFEAPPASLVTDDPEGFRDRIASDVSGLLALLGITADPISSREHILLSNLFDNAWRDGKNLDLASLIRGIQSPPFDKIGVIDLETIYPAKERFALAMSLNNLIASPGFASWMEGEPLNIDRLLHTESGKPRVSILSIAHLDDRERMFFVTILLNEVLSWTRSQPGTTSLRAILYMDEVYGYFPPTANPPSKTPMLTLLKQARAYGLGVVLATQNPVDLDYKGLSNAGTWFLGRLQTERDKARVLEGLEGASAAAGQAFDRGKVERILAGLGNRVFLMNNVHDDAPVVFQTRWDLSYLRGPLTRDQIRLLMADRKEPAGVKSARPSTISAPKTVEKIRVEEPTVSGAKSTKPEGGTRPLLPPEITEAFIPVGTPNRDENGESLLYRPALFGRAQLHFVDKKAGVDLWRDIALLKVIEDGSFPEDVWEGSRVFEGENNLVELEKKPEDDATFAGLPAELNRAKLYADQAKSLKTHLYREQALTLWSCAELGIVSSPDESEKVFRLRLAQSSREERDRRIDALRAKYAPKFQALERRRAQARERLQTEQAQADRSILDAVVTTGSSFLKYWLSKKSVSATNLGRATSAAKAAGRAYKQRSDVGGAAEVLDQINREILELDEDFKREVETTKLALTPESFTLEPCPIRPRKGDLAVDKVILAWTPWRVTANGRAEAAY